MTPSVRPLGARRSLVELIRHLPDSLSPFVVCPAESGICLELKDLGVPTAVVPQGAWRKASGRFIAMVRQIPALWGLVGKFQPHLIHSNEFHTIPHALAASRGRIPVTGHVRLTITPRQIQNYKLAHCARVVVVSDAVKELFSGSGLMDRVRVVYNGVDISRLTPAGSPHAGLEEWLSNRATTERPLVAGLFGLVSERKNQLVALEAVLDARAAGANVVLVLAGDAFGGSMSYGEQLARRLADPAVAEACLWLPFQEDVAGLYRSIDVNLLISKEEGFGRTIIEAGAVSRPSIGSRIGGIPELICAGRTGLLVDEGNAKQLAGKLSQLARNRAEVERLGRGANELVNARFTIAAHVTRMIEAWQECL